MRLLLSNGHFANLSMHEHTNDLTVLFDAFEVFGSSGFGAGSESSVFGEGLLLGLVPIFVESAFDFVGEMGGPDGGERAETTGSFDIADDTADDHRRSLVINFESVDRR